MDAVTSVVLRGGMHARVAVVHRNAHLLQRWVYVVDKRCFGTTDGPFRHMKPNFVERKKHFNEVLVMADRRKLLETAQELLADDSGKKYPRGFWEVLSKRCIQSMHLFNPMETAILLRCLDVNNIQYKHADAFAAAVPRVMASSAIPGDAVVIFGDIFARRLRVSEAELRELLAHLGRRAANVLWEIPPQRAVGLLSAMTSAGAMDSALASRVGRKVLAQLGAEHMTLVDVALAAEAMVGQGHRDLELLKGLAIRAADVSTPGAAACALRVLRSLEALEVDDVPSELSNAVSSLA